MWKSASKLEIVTIHPSFVVGPTLTKRNSSTLEYIAQYMRGDSRGVLNITMPTVDVRDVALAHYLALVKPGISG